MKAGGSVISYATLFYKDWPKTTSRIFSLNIRASDLFVASLKSQVSGEHLDQVEALCKSYSDHYRKDKVYFVVTLKPDTVVPQRVLQLLQAETASSSPPQKAPESSCCLSTGVSQISALT